MMTWRALGENAVIVIGLASFWPAILGYRGWWYECGILAVLAMLAALAVIRFRRVRRALHREVELNIETGSDSRPHP